MAEPEADPRIIPSAGLMTNSVSKAESASVSCVNVAMAGPWSVQSVSFAKFVSSSIPPSQDKTFVIPIDGACRA